MELKINELTIQWRKIVFSANGLVKLDTYMFKKKKDIDTDLISFIKINSKWIIELSLKCKMVRPLEDNKRESLDDLGYGNDLRYSTKGMTHGKKIDKLDSIKNTCSAVIL